MYTYNPKSSVGRKKGVVDGKKVLTVVNLSLSFFFYPGEGEDPVGGRNRNSREDEVRQLEPIWHLDLYHLTLKTQ